MPHTLSAGKNVPEVVNAFVEIPKGSRNKYEYDKEAHVWKLDRVLYSSVAYPSDYGYIPKTLSDDGDPLDVLIVNRFATFPGCVVEARPIGALKMVDSGDNDEKIIAVPAHDPYFNAYKDFEDIPEAERAEIEEFFKTYKNLQKGKFVEMKGWVNRAGALALIKEAIKTYEKKQEKNREE